MTERRPSPTTETIAEALQACLALVAVVLLARSQVGAFDKTPPAWVVMSFSVLMWTAAAWATRWSRSPSTVWIAAWRNCIAPGLITLIVGGRGSLSLLLAELAVVGLGTVAVGSMAYRAKTVAFCSAKERSSEAQTETNDEASLTPAPPPTIKLTPSAESIEGERELTESIQPLDSSQASLPQGTCLTSPDAGLTEPAESPATESWSRRDSDGEVAIEAVVLARFAEGSKLAVVHLPFMPSLPQVPQIECEPLDSGCEVTITTEAAYRHGAKLSVTRRTAGPAESVPIGIVIYTSDEEEIESLVLPLRVSTSET